MQNQVSATHPSTTDCEVLHCGINSSYLCRGESVQFICPVFSICNIHYCRNITLIFRTRFFLHKAKHIKKKEIIMPFYWESTLIPVTFDTSPIHISVPFAISLPQTKRPRFLRSTQNPCCTTSLTNAPEHYLSHHTKHCFPEAVSAFLTSWSVHWLHCPRRGCSIYPTNWKIQQWTKNQLWPTPDKCCSVFKKPASSLQCLINHKCC